MRPHDHAIFTDDSLSLHSFRVATAHHPPSLKASSLRHLGAASFANILGSRGRKRPTLNDLTLDGPDLGLLPTLPKMPDATKNSTPEVQPATEQRTRSKPRTIIRMLSTKFIPRSASAPAISSAPRTSSIRPPAVPVVFSKEQRDAALRERGLLPSLRPNKDLSLQETEQDQHIPVVPSASSAESTHETETSSAADQIKKDWEARNRSVEVTQRDRMNAFKFGGQTEATEVQSSLPVPPSSSSSPHPESQDESQRPLTPLIELSPEVEAYIFASPPSPSGVSAAPSPTIPEADIPNTSLAPVDAPTPTPTSPSLHSNTDADRTASGACTPRPQALDACEAAAVPIPTAPLISLTPPTAFSSPTKDLTFDEDQKVSAIPADEPTPPASASATSLSASLAFHARTDSFARLEETVSGSSLLTPSLSIDSGSGSGASDSASLASAPSKPIGLGKLGGLGNIPIIIESSVESEFASDALDIVVEEEPAAIATPVSEPLMPPKASVTVTVSEPPTSPTTTKRPTKRSAADHAANMDRRKSLNPFKRNQTDGGEQPQQRRLGVSASLSNMRRSVVGTLSRPKNGHVHTLAGDGGDGPAKTFDASHLPAPPMLPSGSGFNGTVRPAAVRSRTLPPQRPRQPVAPVVYSRGSILVETSNIEDEESRRMTEMAFLG